MRVRSSLAILALGLMAGCDQLPEPSFLAQPDPEVELGQFRYGTVHWHQVESDCLDDAWSYDEAVTVLVEGESVSMWFDTMPQLDGKLVGGQAAVAGTQQFPGDSGTMVSCVVDGSVNVSDAGVDGEMHEALTSTGDVNCSSRGRYTVTFAN